MSEDIPREVKDKDGWLDAQLLDSHGQELSQWEVDFLESIMQQMRKGHFLSGKQRMLLGNLVEEKT
jgi:hypothetical protein